MTPETVTPPTEWEPGLLGQTDGGQQLLTGAAR